MHRTMHGTNILLQEKKKNSHKIRRKKEKDEGKETKIYNFYLIFGVI